ncbi:sigma-70 family RNA polymerase sigma factor [Pseudidiomarina sediminum]|uniref:Sigma-70 family RNA polymerase sigma factor n=1 Tax=Pseudidiomarina sediminum TaxID=431675 RepID=A0A432Z429_9GAMM|nr:sigma-70 family RNA polymerase sigma factor [Pseudidiomarina sediminum]MBY6062776.1 sigma-70 family RNA polymerase sigma factor [Pseudidiomarina sediminum]RUO72579.1 sigma-70 family RNA polymerase sigma factor [Pseudidiomarina sediminum]
MANIGFAQKLPAETIRAAQQGRRDGQRALFETYQSAVQRLLLGMCRDQELARDLTQDVFLQVFNKVKQLRDPEAIGGWLKQLTINTALSHFRKPQHQSVDADDPAFELDASDWLSQSDWLQQLDSIEELMAQLEPHEYQLIWLYLVEGYSHEELAEMFAEQPATIRQRYHRALKKLRERSQA